MIQLSLNQWLLASVAAILVGFSKTGMPGVGILVVPLLAAAFGGRESVGIMLPMLIFADVFAVAWYRRHTQWDRLWKLFPTVLPGMFTGFVLLIALGDNKAPKNTMNVVIGVMVLGMLALHLLRFRLGDKLAPHSQAGVLFTGSMAGFTTTASNAAGPIMSIYLTSLGMPKDQFMGTTAWFFFTVNLLKLPLFAVITMITPDRPVMTGHSLLIDAVFFPIILIGVVVGKKLLPIIPQKAFDSVVLGLAAIAAVRLLFN